MSICKGCGQEIKWIRTGTGRSMPCDLPPVKFMPGGGPDTFITESGKVERGKKDKLGIKGYRSHFATCPCAGAFRKKGREGNDGN